MIKKTGLILLLILINSTFPCKVDSAVLSTTRIAFVDIEQVFSEFEGTRLAKKKISEEIRIKREEIIRMEAELRWFEREIANKRVISEKETLTGLIQGGQDEIKPENYETQPGTDSYQAEDFKVDGATSAVNRMPGQEAGTEVVTSTGTPESPEIEALEKNRREIEDKIQDARQNLLESESSAKNRILGRIYDIIKEVAEEEGYYIVLSKDDVLFSEEENIDLTEKVIQRLNEE